VLSSIYTVLLLLLVTVQLRPNYTQSDEHVAINNSIVDVPCTSKRSCTSEAFLLLNIAVLVPSRFVAGRCFCGSGSSYGSRDYTCVDPTERSWSGTQKGAIAVFALALGATLVAFLLLWCRERQLKARKAEHASAAPQEAPVATVVASSV
jgi:hypothetical protein